MRETESEKMNLGSILLLVWLLVGLLIAANQHGKYKTGKDNFWWTLLGVIIILVFCYLGGMFR